MSNENIKTHTIANSTRTEVDGKTYENISTVNTSGEITNGLPERRKSLDHTKDALVRPKRKTSLDHTWEPQSQVDIDVRMCKALCKNEENKFMNMDRMFDRQKHEAIKSQDFAMSKYHKKLERYKKAKS